MAKVFGILMLVLGVWLGIEIYTKGTHEAFGGALAWLDGDDGGAAGDAAPVDPRSTAQRIRDNVRGNINAGAARTTGSGNPEAELDSDDVMKNDADDIDE